MIETEVVNVNRRLERVYDAIETGKEQLADLAPRLHELKGRMESFKNGKTNSRRF